MLSLPESYFMSVGLAAVLLVYGGLNLNTSWGIPYLAVIFTIAAWYFIEPIYFPGEFLYFGHQNVETAYYAVFISLLSFAALTPSVVRSTRPKRGNRSLSTAYVSAERVLVFVALLWLMLLAYG